MKLISKKDFLLCVYYTFYSNDINYISHLNSALSLFYYYKSLDSEKDFLEYINKQKGFIQL